MSSNTQVLSDSSRDLSDSYDFSEVFEKFQIQAATNQAQFYWKVSVGPFYGFNRPLA
jgi:hypothetical protein